MRDTQEFFLSLNIPICDVYGLSETSAPHTVNLPDSSRIGSAGRNLTGVRSKIAVLDNDGNGEICMYGRHVFMGYLGLRDETQRTFDKENYFLSGDIGKFDQDGYLFITGRVKELLKTAGGEKIAPLALEDNIKAELPIVSQAMVIGDKRKFLSVFLTLKTEMDIKSGKPLDTLTAPAQAWIEEKCKVSVTTLAQARYLDVLKKEIQRGIDKANLKAQSNAQVVRKFLILPVDFSVPGGELGPTLKLKRPSVVEKYADEIEELYDGH
ncbi:hypothetical protein RvY_18748-1 [Ramazzottius varieornatus]|uniref:long-chain-fatty-acid--CoA ligase n=1 Tax=Ramazzottius varieornatus TaxID=947166 RepID=A0A1D1W765_RAMVA|nr:hypothetical protein RvY_18748-1 [Ramazzottius varieornatus]